MTSGSWSAARTTCPSAIAGTGIPRTGPRPRSAGRYTPEHQGRGFATEGARAALEHAYGSLGWQTAVSCIREENAASRRVAERLGARLERLFDWEGQSVCLYRYASPNRT
ncbi:MAG: GNAT family N-acetyltransferase [Notoacmeibacter sp.]|nr:GNAT family N-acetyltransferase [Notoacmeibacter sp.]